MRSGGHNIATFFFSFPYVYIFFLFLFVFIQQMKWPMTVIGSCDSFGNFVPLATMLCSGSSQENFVMFLSHFKGSLGDRIPETVTVITDKSDPERLAIRASLPNSRVRLCYWHFMEAVRRWLVMAVNGVKDKADQLLVKDVRAGTGVSAKYVTVLLS